MPDILNRDKAAKIPESIRFGTSSWTYPGWNELVYFKKYKNEKEFRANALSEYAACPWFRTVGIDSAFYSPPSLDQLRRYAAQVPGNFYWISKVWEEITVPSYAKHKRYGAKAGKGNPNFLNADLFNASVLEVCKNDEIKPHVGPFVFEFQTFDGPMAKEPQIFLEKLNNFLSQLPKDFRYSIELRTPALLTPEYFQTLNKHEVTHCFNHWTRMPALVDQMKHAAMAGGLAADFLVARILTPLGLSYRGAVERFSPYNKIKEPNPNMRKDVIRLLKRALQKGNEVFVVINNRVEGNAPLTIEAIGSALLEELDGKP
jgi:uncharacterized protein YecE (DUF72 family)